MTDFKLTILGSGTMMPTKRRHPAAYLVQAEDTKILMDCGHTTIARLVDMGINLHDINPLTISHFHTDHFSDFMPFIHARWVDDKLSKKLRRPLTVFAPAGFTERWHKFREIFWVEPKENYPFDLVEGTTKKKINHVTIETFPIQHVTWFKSQGTKITYKGKTLVYTGDVSSLQPIDDLARNLNNIDLLVVECGALKPGGSHFTAEQAIELKQKANIKQILLSHLRDKNIPAIKKAIARFDTVTIAKDKQVIEL